MYGRNIAYILASRIGRSKGEQTRSLVSRLILYTRVVCDQLHCLPTSVLNDVTSPDERLLLNSKVRLTAMLNVLMDCTVLERLRVSLCCLWAASWQPSFFRNALRTCKSYSYTLMHTHTHTHVSVEDAVHEEYEHPLCGSEEAEQPLHHLREGAVPHNEEP